MRAKDVAPQMAAARHFDGPDNRFIKHVVAPPGDRVCAQGAAISINDQASITPPHDIFIWRRTIVEIPDLVGLPAIA